MTGDPRTRTEDTAAVAPQPRAEPAPPVVSDLDGALVLDADPGRAAAAGELSARDRAVLDFERRWWRSPGAKEQAVRDTFGLSPTRYYQVLRTVLEQPAALAHDPVLVGRLRRLRTRRGRAGAPAEPLGDDTSVPT